MPELPQVQGFVNYFKYTALHQPIAACHCAEEDLLNHITCQELGRKLSRQQFAKAYRRGKYLIAEFENNENKLVIHFGMTGNLCYARQDNLSAEVREQAKLIIVFTNQYQLIYTNVRKLGKIYLVKDIADIKALDSMGPEPLELNEQTFLDCLNAHSNKNIKSFLMDQSLLAGIGNEFSNEILFQMEMNPRLKISALNDKQKIELFACMQHILQKAVDLFSHDKDARTYPDHWLLAHQQDMNCPKNKNHDLKKETVAGRTALFCPTHQG